MSTFYKALLSIIISAVAIGASIELASIAIEANGADFRAVDGVRMPAFIALAGIVYILLKGD